jgi:type III restriction enzyme
MKYTLKDYQEDAVADVLVNMRKARKRWHEDGHKQAFSLTATTGAGKTVTAQAISSMIASVIAPMISRSRIFVPL